MSDHYNTFEKKLSLTRNALESIDNNGFGVTLRSSQRDYFFDMIDNSFLGVKEKYIKTFGNQYMCNSPNARNLCKVFKNECEKLGLLYKMNDIIYSYKNEYNNEQLSLFNI